MATKPPSPFLEDLDIIVLGSINPPIFEPAWLAAHDLINSQQFDEALTDANLLVAKEVTRISFSNVTIIAQEDRVQIGSPDATKYEYVRDLAVNIFSLLKHTPVKAVGINRRAHYRIQDEEKWHLIGDTLAPKDRIWKTILPNPGLCELKIKSPRSDNLPGSTTIAIAPSQRVSPGEFGVFISTNWHGDIVKPDESRYPDTETAHKLVSFIESQWDNSMRCLDIAASKILGISL